MIINVRRFYILTKMNIIKAIISFVIALTLLGCGNSEAEKLYNSAVQIEQQHGGQISHKAIEAYRQVIKTAPGTKWADKAQARIDVIQKNISDFLK